MYINFAKHVTDQMDPLQRYYRKLIFTHANDFIREYDLDPRIAIHWLLHNKDGVTQFSEWFNKKNILHVEPYFINGNNEDEFIFLGVKLVKDEKKEQLLEKVQND